jgi:hypothetical protein
MKPTFYRLPVLAIGLLGSFAFSTRPGSTGALRANPCNIGDRCAGICAYALDTVPVLPVGRSGNVAKDSAHTLPAKDFKMVETSAEFPGGDGQWNAYASQFLSAHMDELLKDNRSGTCMMQFIVDKDGSLIDIEAMTMLGSKLAELCVEMVKNGPKWAPAQENGHAVKAFRRQNISFQMPPK